MRPTYSNVIRQPFRAKKGKPEEKLGIIIPTRVYYDKPKRLPWEPVETDPVTNKYVEFAFLYNGVTRTDRYSWYKFFTIFERID